MTMDTALDGRPMIRCAWPDAGRPSSPRPSRPVHSLEETAEYMASIGDPISPFMVAVVELAALRKMAIHPVMRAMAMDFGYQPCELERARRNLNRALPGLACDFSLRGIEVESAEVEEHVVFEAVPVTVAA